METEAQEKKTGWKGPKPGRPPGTKDATVKDLKNILQLQLMGYTQEQIAERIGHSRMFVNRVLQKHDKEVRARLEGDVLLEKQRQVRALDFAVQESARAWAVSKGEDPDQTVQAAPTAVRRAPVARPGEVAYLKEMRAALADQRSVFGIGQTVVEGSFSLSQVVEAAEQMALEASQEEGAAEEES